MDDPEYVSNSEEDNYEEGSDTEDNNLSLNKEEELDNQNWNINIKNEEKFWLFLKNSGFTDEPYRCPNCQIEIYELKSLKRSNLINPYFLRCNYKYCV